MTIDDEIRDKKLLKVFTEKQQKYQHYHVEKFVILNIL